MGRGVEKLSLLNGVASRTTYLLINDQIFIVLVGVLVVGSFLFFIFGFAGVSCGYREY